MRVRERQSGEPCTGVLSWNAGHQPIYPWRWARIITSSPLSFLSHCPRVALRLRGIKKIPVTQSGGAALRRLFFRIDFRLRERRFVVRWRIPEQACAVFDEDSHLYQNGQPQPMAWPHCQIKSELLHVKPIDEFTSEPLQPSIAMRALVPDQPIFKL